MADVTVKRSGMLPKAPRLALMREMRQRDRQRWRDARRAMLSRLPTGAVWHVAVVAAGREAKAERALVENGFLAYTPLERMTIGTGAARRDIDRPLFPKYVFFSRQRESASIGAVREIRNVLGGIGGQWLAAPDRLVHGLIDSEGLGVFDRTDGKRAVQRSARRVRLSTGSDVTILTGPLAGFPAKIMAIDTDARVKCLVRMFGGDVPVEVGIDKIEAAA